MKAQLHTLFIALQTGMNLRTFWGERAIHCTLNAETKVKVENLFPNIAVKLFEHDEGPFLHFLYREVLAFDIINHLWEAFELYS